MYKKISIFFITLLFFAFFTFFIKPHLSIIRAAASNKSPNDSPMKPVQDIINLLFFLPEVKITPVNTTPIPTGTDIHTGGPSPALTISPINTTGDVALVQRLIGQIYSTCGPTINADIISKVDETTKKRCIDDYPYPLNMAVAAFIESTITKNFYHLQCIGFVKGIVRMTTGIEWGDVASRAKGLLDAPPKGYHPIHRDDTKNHPIRPGDLAIFNYDTYGHIAYVIGVDPSGKTFVIAEANSNGKGLVQINTRPFSITNPALEGWLRRDE